MKPKPLNAYQTELTIRLDWSDLDYFKHINNVSYFRFVQSARVHYWDCIELTEHHGKTNIGPILASCSCTFIKALHYPGNVVIRTEILWLKNTSFSLQHTMYNDSGEVIAEANDVIVVYDFNNNAKHPIPEFIRKNIEKLEKKQF